VRRWDLRVAVIASARRAAGHRLSGACLVPPCSREACGKRSPLRLCTERCCAASATGEEEPLNPRGDAVAEASTVEQAVVADAGLFEQISRCLRSYLCLVVR
jgi:hypothetical protein